MTTRSIEKNRGKGVKKENGDGAARDVGGNLGKCGSTEGWGMRRWGAF